MTTINDVYAKQDASDMFFNHETVTKAYSNAIAAVQEDSSLVLRDEFLANVENADMFDKEDVAVIVDDFLKRV